MYVNTFLPIWLKGILKPILGALASEAEVAEDAEDAEDAEEAQAECKVGWGRRHVSLLADRGWSWSWYGMIWRDYIYIYDMYAYYTDIWYVCK